MKLHSSAKTKWLYPCKIFQIIYVFWQHEQQLTPPMFNFIMSSIIHLTSYIVGYKSFLCIAVRGFLKINTNIALYYYCSCRCTILLKVYNDSIHYLYIFSQISIIRGFWGQVLVRPTYMKYSQTSIIRGFWDQNLVHPSTADNRGPTISRKNDWPL